MTAQRPDLDRDLRIAISDSKTHRDRQIADISTSLGRPVPSSSWASIDPELQHQLLSAGLKHYIQHTLGEDFTFPPLGSDGRPNRT